MINDRPIILVFSSRDATRLISQLISDLGIINNIKDFDNCKDVLEYMKTTKDEPLLIFSDIKLPNMSGIEFRQKIVENPYLRDKSIPFIFLAAQATPAEIKHAYLLQIQGFFLRSNDAVHMSEVLSFIFGYWQRCLEPKTAGVFSPSKIFTSTTKISD